MNRLFLSLFLFISFISYDISAQDSSHDTQRAIDDDVSETERRLSMLCDSSYLSDATTSEIINQLSGDYWVFFSWGSYLVDRVCDSNSDRNTVFLMALSANPSFEVISLMLIYDPNIYSPNASGVSAINIAEGEVDGYDIPESVREIILEYRDFLRRQRSTSTIEEYERMEEYKIWRERLEKEF